MLFVGEEGSGSGRLQVDRGGLGESRHQRTGVELAGGSHSGKSKEFGSLIVAGDRSLVGQFQESDELCRTPVSPMVVAAAVGVAPGRGLIPTFRSLAQAA